MSQKKTGIIGVDRDKADFFYLIKEVKNMMISNAYKKIMIFPEGTRRTNSNGKKYKKGIYQTGVYYFAKFLKLPVIPVGIDSGKFWPQGGIKMKTGKISVNIGEPISYDLSEKEFMDRLKMTLIN